MTAGDDASVGNAAQETVPAGSGDDTLTGAGGADNLTGGPGADTFVYKTVDESPATEIGTSTDVITDMNNSGDDTIDLSAHGLSTDKNAVPDKSDIGDDKPFDTTGNTSEFFDDGGTDRAVALETNGSGGDSRVFVDANGNGDFDTADDLVIELTGTQNVTADDFAFS